MYKLRKRVFKESDKHTDAKDQVDNVSYSPETIFQDPSAEIFFSFSFFSLQNNHTLSNKKQAKNKCQELLINLMRTYTYRILLEE